MKILPMFYLKPTVFLLLSLLFFGQCIETNRKPKMDNNELCSSFGFTETTIEQIIRIKKPFIVRNICGTVVLLDGSPMIAGVIIEIRKKVKDWKTEKIYKTTTDEKGEFILKEVKQGRYCFKMTFEGWQSIVGEIWLTEKADERNRINLTIEPGV